MGRATHGLPPRSFLPHNLDKPDKYFKDLTNTQQIPDNLLSDVANLGIRASLYVLVICCLHSGCILLHEDNPKQPPLNRSNQHSEEPKGLSFAPYFSQGIQALSS